MSDERRAAVAEWRDHDARAPLGIDSTGGNMPLFPPPIPERIAALEAEIDRLRRERRELKRQHREQRVREQREQLVRAIERATKRATTRVPFSAAELWESQDVNAELRDALAHAGIIGPGSLGRHLQRLHDDPPDLPVVIERDDEIDHVTIWIVKERGD